MGNLIGMICILWFSPAAAGWTAESIYIADYQDKAVIYGAGEQDNIGKYLDRCGDVNGDGLDDFVLGTEENVGWGPYDNYGYIIMGASDFPSLINLDSPPPGTVVIEHPRFSQLPVAGLGDFNGDGYSDVAFADPIASIGDISQAGRVFVMFGGVDLATEELDFDNPQTPGVMINGYRKGACLGVTLSSAGDVNGDGLGDVLMGAFGGVFSEAYLVFGGTDMPSSLSVDNLAAHGVRLTGQIGIGGGVSRAGDVNGDGLSDFVVGAGSLEDQRLGHVYLIYGATDWASEIDTRILGELGVDIAGTRTDEGFGRDMSAAGDVNGDGYDDVVFSSLLADPEGVEDAGQVFLLFGSPELPNTLQNTELGQYGITINGVYRNHNLGRGLAWLGDINQDGLADFSVCSTRRNEANFIFGSKNMTRSGSVRIDELERVRFWGIVPENSGLGSAVANVGDINADGFDDIMIGDFGRTTNDNFAAGTVYIIYGRANRFQTLQQRCDLNQDGVINHLDLFLFGAEWQEGE